MPGEYVEWQRCALSGTAGLLQGRRERVQVYTIRFSPCMPPPFFRGGRGRRQTNTLAIREGGIQIGGRHTVFDWFTIVGLPKAANVWACGRLRLQHIEL